MNEEGVYDALNTCDPKSLEACDPELLRSCALGHKLMNFLCTTRYVHERPADFLECARLLVQNGSTANTDKGALKILIFKEVSSHTIADFMKLTKANPDHTGRLHPQTPLLLAIIQRSVSTVQTLLKAGANPCLGELENVQNSFAIAPSIPLHEAVAWGNVEVVYELLAYGADPFQKDPLRNLTAVDWARHAATVRTPSAHATKLLRLFEDLEYARTRHFQYQPLLHKELCQIIFHPVRLQKQGVFNIVE